MRVCFLCNDVDCFLAIPTGSEKNWIDAQGMSFVLGWAGLIHSQRDSTTWAESHLLQQAKPLHFSTVPVTHYKGIPQTIVPCSIMQVGMWVGFPERNIVSAALQGHVHAYTQLISF